MTEFTVTLVSLEDRRTYNKSVTSLWGPRGDFKSKSLKVSDTGIPCQVHPGHRAVWVSVYPTRLPRAPSTTLPPESGIWPLCHLFFPLGHQICTWEAEMLPSESAVWMFHITRSNPQVFWGKSRLCKLLAMLCCSFWGQNIKRKDWKVFQVPALPFPFPSSPSVRLWYPMELVKNKNLFFKNSPPSEPASEFRWKCVQL